MLHRETKRNIAGSAFLKFRKFASFRYDNEQCIFNKVRATYHYNTNINLKCMSIKMARVSGSGAEEMLVRKKH